MKNKDNSTSIISYVKTLFTNKNSTKNSNKKYSRIANHQPSWMYRNE